MELATTFKLSEQQQAVLDWADTHPRESLTLLARAGCGKSSTLLALVQHIVAKGQHTSIFIGAYNRPIADEFIAKLADAKIDWRSANCNTLHGAGLGAWRKVTGWSPNEASKHIDDQKLAKLLEEEMRTDEQKEKVAPYLSMILKTVSMAKQRAFGVLCSISDTSKWYEIIDHFGFDEDLIEDADLEFAVNICIWLYKRSLKRCHDVIDFDDMILAPLFHKAKFWQYDWVMIDEAQDTNPARRALAFKMLKPGGRFVAVGDDWQAIYGFTGADSDSLDIITKSLNSRVLPLNVTYRCPKVGVRRVQQWVPDFQAHPSAPEGTERTIYLTEAREGMPPRAHVLQEQFTADDAILCRNTKPLIALAYMLLRNGVPCKVEGRKIATGLIGLINKWSVANISTLLPKLEEYCAVEVQKWLSKGKESKAEDINDRCETIVVLGEKLLGEGKTKVVDLIGFIDGMFTDTPDGKDPRCLTLATAHKSKGREWNRVFILGQSKYMPSKWARKEWQYEQELHLMYVANTRFKSEIVDIIVEE